MQSLKRPGLSLTWRGYDQYILSSLRTQRNGALSPRRHLINNTAVNRPSSSRRRSLAEAVSLRQCISTETTGEQTDQDRNNGFDFFLAASWHPKQSRSKAQNGKGKSLAYWKRTQVGKVNAGEDAFFHTSTKKGLALGVADGVGGWAEVGVDPALFSWTLMNNAADAAKYATESLNHDAQAILQKAFDDLVSEGSVEAGSSTACIIDICKSSGRMTTANIGDSAFLLIRDQQIIFESATQQHFFNCPYQLTVLPASYKNRENHVIDEPKDAIQNEFDLQHGDIIVLATDGFFDNVFSSEALQIVNAEFADITTDASAQGDSKATSDAVVKKVRHLSRTLADTARRFSLNQKRLSPWALSARMHGARYMGGKVDDITCLVAYVHKS